MSEISLPAGAFAAMKAGNPQPVASEPKAEVAADKPKTITRKAVENVVPKPVEKEPEEAEEKPPENLTPAEKKIWKLKADGEEFDFDATDEEAVKKEIMKARGADKRFDSAAALKKQAETWFEMIKNPDSLKKVLSDPRIGVDIKKFAQDTLWEIMQEEKMSPEQKTQRERDQRLAAYEANEAKEKEGRENTEKQARQAHYETGYEQKITKALEIGGIPKTHGSVQRMADYLMQSIEHGHDLSPEELVQEVKKDYLSDFNSVLSAADGDQLLAFIGEATAEKIRKAELKKLKSAQGNPFPQRSTPKPGSTPIAPKRMSSSEWKDEVAKSFMNRPR